MSALKRDLISAGIRATNGYEGAAQGLARPSQETLRAAEEPADRICCSLLAPRYTCEHSEPLPPTAQRGRCPGRSAT